MHERLSFHIKRDSVLHSLNPLTKLVLTLTLILIAFTSPWYWTPHLLVIVAIIPLSLLGKVFREFSLTAIRLILPAASFLFLMQAFFQPIGHDVILNFISLISRKKA
ncbi:MAG: CbiQ family ECF transporter T component [Anaerolineales bacterium]